MRSLRLPAVLCLLAWCAVSQAAINSWSPIGPNGGTIYAVAIDPSNASILFAATLAGAFKSTDAGDHWTKVFPLECGGIAIHPTSSSIVFLTDRNRQVYKSIDGGQTFTSSSTGITSIGQGTLFGRFAFQPGNPSTMFFAWPTGLFKSTDGGANWEASDAGAVLGQGVREIAVDSVNPNVVYLALRSKGVYKSVDAGVTWNPSNSGLPFVNTTISVNAFAQDPGSPQTLYVLSGNDRKLYASSDAGGTWTVRSTSALGFASSLLVAPGNGQTLYGGGVDSDGASPTYLKRIFKSSDGGVTWSNVTSSVFAGYSNVAPLAIPSGSPLTLYAALGNGLSKTIDGATNWAPINTGLRADETDYRIGFNPSSPSNWYVQYAQSGIYKTTDSGATLSPVNGNLVSAGLGTIVVDPTNPQILLAAGQTPIQYSSDPHYTAYLVRSVDGGITWGPVNDPAYPTGFTNLQAWGFVAVPTIPTTFFAMGSSDGVYKSTDGGVNFVRLNTGLPTKASRTFNSNISAADNTGTTLYVATAAGVFKTSDGGATWATPGTGLPTGAFRNLAVSPLMPQRVLVLYGTTIYRSLDSGSTWNPASVTFPSAPVAMAMDPSAPGTVYVAGTLTTGAVRSIWIQRTTDGGNTWNAFTSQGLDQNATFIMTVDAANSNHLLIGTRGGLSELTLVAPGITAINPSSGPTTGAQSVTITGTTLGGATVTIGGNVANVSANTDTTITFTTPAHVAGAVDVAVTTVGGTASSAGGYTYIAATPPAPANVLASATSASSVLISWSNVASADSYRVFRRTSGSFSQVSGDVNSPNFTDSTAVPNTSYWYMVRAVTSGLPSSDSNSDLATTVVFTDDPLILGTTKVKALHLTEMRQAVDSVLLLAGLAAATWTDGSPSGVPIRALHITELRTALNAARSALALSALTYTNTLTAGTSRIATIDFTEIRNGTR